MSRGISNLPLSGGGGYCYINVTLFKPQVRGADWTKIQVIVLDEGQQKLLDCQRQPQGTGICL